MVDLVIPDFPIVPLVFKGPHHKADLDELTTGMSLMANQNREGAVIKSSVERIDIRLDRVILKSTSPKRKVTEFS